MLTSPLSFDTASLTDFKTRSNDLSRLEVFPPMMSRHPDRQSGRKTLEVASSSRNSGQRGKAAMFIVHRKFREYFRIGETVKVVVLNQKGGRLRIGVEAPDNLAVVPEEIYQRGKREHNSGRCS